MFHTEDKEIFCDVRKMGCDGGFFENEQNLECKIKKLKEENKELKIQRDYYKKMYLESYNFLERK